MYVWALHVGARFFALLGQCRGRSVCLSFSLLWSFGQTHRSAPTATAHYALLRPYSIPDISSPPVFLLYL